MEDDGSLKITLLRHLAERGYHGRIVSIQRLEDLREGLECFHRQGELDPSFYRARLAEFSFGPPDALADARSLIVIAYRDPMVRFTFQRHGVPVRVTVPPTYLHWIEKDRAVERTLRELLAPTGYRLGQARVPKKLLAVCSGLAAYGRNNIAYVRGMGSYHRLAAFCSDLPCDVDEWPGPRAMDRCERCHACERACPTGAIDEARFLIHAERCITYWNEEPPDVPFPSWMKRQWHNALVGCMHCQVACPENRDVIGQVLDGGEFSEEETLVLLQGSPIDEMPDALKEKLQKWDLREMVDTLPRNLGVLFDGGGDAA